MTVLALSSSRGDVDCSIQVLRERFKQAQADYRRALNDRGYPSTLSREPTDAQLRAVRTPSQHEALVISSTRPVNFTAASAAKPWRCPRVVTVR